jgi:hypothetical protein
MNLIDQAKTLMQGCGADLENSESYNFCGEYLSIFSKTFLCKVCKAKASQMLIDLTNEKEWLLQDQTTFSHQLRLKEINSAIEILGGKNG